MDTITQALLGAVCGNVVARHKLGKRAARWGAIGGALPDIDVFTALIGQWADMQHHRGVTHALWFGPVVGSLIGWLLWRRYARLREREPAHEDAALGAPDRLRWWMLLLAVSILSHPLLDLYTTYGTQLWAPLSDTRYAWNGVGIVDPLYSLALVAALLWGRGHTRKTIRASTVGLWLTSCYLFYGVYLNHGAETLAREQLSTQGVSVRSVRAYPGILQLFLRRVVVRAHNGDWYIGQLSMWAPHRIRFYRTREVDHPLVARLRQSERGQLFEWFAMEQTLAHVEQQNGELVVSLDDMRYGAMTDPEHSMWGIRQRFSEQGEPLGEVERFRNTTNARARSLGRMFRDTFSPQP